MGALALRGAHKGRSCIEGVPKEDIPRRGDILLRFFPHFSKFSSIFFEKYSLVSVVQVKIPPYL
jgi:hypothetical protein